MNPFGDFNGDVYSDKNKNERKPVEPTSSSTINLISPLQGSLARQEPENAQRGSGIGSGFGSVGSTVGAIKTSLNTYWKPTDTENATYEQYFRMFDTGNKGTVTIQETKEFFKRSLLEDIVLNKIQWLSDSQQKGYLNKDEFKIYLKLISLAQNKENVSLANLDKKVDLPKLYGVKSPVEKNETISRNGSTSRSVFGEDDLDIGVGELKQYESLFYKNNGGGNRIDGEIAKVMMLKSNLGGEELNGIWKLSNPYNLDYMDKRGFLTAMYYIRRFMNGKISKVPITVPEKLQKAMIDFCIDSPHEKKETQTFDGRKMTERMNESVWKISEQDEAKYGGMFENLDKARAGELAGGVLVDYFKQSGLDDNELATVWGITDVGSKGKLTKPEFVIAMVLINKRLHENVGIPIELPATYLTYINEHNSKKTSIFGQELESIGVKRSKTTMRFAHSGSTSPHYRSTDLGSVKSQQVQQGKDKIRELETLLAQKTQEMEENSSLRNSVNVLLASIETEKQNLMMKIEACNSTLEIEKRIIGELQAKLQQERIVLDDLNKKCQMGSVMLEQGQEQKRDLVEKIRGITAELNDIRIQQTEKQNENNNILQDIQELSHKSAELEKEVAFERNVFSELEQKIGENDKTKGELESKFQLKQQEHSSLKQKTHESEAVIRAQEDELKDLKGRMVVLEDELQREIEKQKELIRTHERIQKELELELEREKEMENKQKELRKSVLELESTLSETKIKEKGSEREKEDGDEDEDENEEKDEKRVEGTGDHEQGKGDILDIIEKEKNVTNENKAALVNVEPIGDPEGEKLSEKEPEEAKKEVLEMAQSVERRDAYEMLGETGESGNKGLGITVEAQMEGDAGHKEKVEVDEEQKEKQDIVIEQKPHINANEMSTEKPAQGKPSHIMNNETLKLDHDNHTTTTTTTHTTEPSTLLPSQKESEANITSTAPLIPLETTDSESSSEPDQRVSVSSNQLDTSNLGFTSFALDSSPLSVSKKHNADANANANFNKRSLQNELDIDRGSDSSSVSELENIALSHIKPIDKATSHDPEFSEKFPASLVGAGDSVANEGNRLKDEFDLLFENLNPNSSKLIPDRQKSNPIETVRPKTGSDLDFTNIFAPSASSTQPDNLFSNPFVLDSEPISTDRDIDDPFLRIATSADVPTSFTSSPPPPIFSENINDAKPSASKSTRSTALTTDSVPQTSAFPVPSPQNRFSLTKFNFQDPKIDPIDLPTDVANPLPSTKSNVSSFENSTHHDSPEASLPTLHTVNAAKTNSIEISPVLVVDDSGAQSKKLANRRKSKFNFLNISNIIPTKSSKNKKDNESDSTKSKSKKNKSSLGFSRSNTGTIGRGNGGSGSNSRQGSRSNSGAPTSDDVLITTALQNSLAEQEYNQSYVENNMTDADKAILKNRDWFSNPNCLVTYLNLKNMGFEPSKVADALELNNFNFNVAMDYLLKNS